jgi:type IV pilus assembly protein PilX
MIVQVRFPDKQQGVVLIVGLIMLLLLTVIGLASIRGSDLQERMAGNMRDRNLGFQAAEAGLRLGEKVLSLISISAKFDGTTVGYYPDLNLVSVAAPPLPPRPTQWTKAQWLANSILVPAATLDGLSEQPRYTTEKLIVPQYAVNKGGAVDFESLGRLADVEFYRVTSRGVGGTADTEVLLQSTFIR